MLIFIQPLIWLLSHGHWSLTKSTNMLASINCACESFNFLTNLLWWSEIEPMWDVHVYERGVHFFASLGCGNVAYSPPHSRTFRSTPRLQNFHHCCCEVIFSLNASQSFRNLLLESLFMYWRVSNSPIIPFLLLYQILFWTASSRHSQQNFCCYKTSRCVFYLRHSFV